MLSILYLPNDSYDQHCPNHIWEAIISRLQKEKIWVPLFL